MGIGPFSIGAAIGDWFGSAYSQSWGGELDLKLNEMQIRLANQHGTLADDFNRIRKRDLAAGLKDAEGFGSASVQIRLPIFFPLWNAKRLRLVPQRFGLSG